jgi:MFS family permease
MAAIAASSMIGRVVMGRVGDVFGNKSAFVMSYLATAIAMIWVLITRELWGLYLFAFVFGFGWGAQAVLRFAVTSAAFGLVSLGLIMGVLGLAEACAGAFGSYFSGYLFDIFGNYEPAFWIGLGVSIMGVVSARLLKSVDHNLP